MNINAHPPEIRRITPADAPALVAFYNQLSAASKRTFRPLGPVTVLEKCEEIIRENENGTKYDLVAVDDDARSAGRGIIGWSFLWELDTDKPSFGLAVADAYHGQGLGTGLMTRVLDAAREMNLPAVYLIVVTDNVVAQHVYEKQGFVRYGEGFTGEDGLPYHRMKLRF